MNPKEKPAEEKEPENGAATERTNPNIEPDTYNYAKDPILAKEAYDFAKDLHSTLKRKRKPFENIWAECNDAFRTVEKKTYFNAGLHYCSSDIRDACLTIFPKLAKALFYSDVPFELVPVGQKGEDDSLVDINKQILSWDFRNLRIYLKYVDSIFQKGIFGTTIVKTPPHFEMITKQLRQWKENPIAGQGHLAKSKKLERKEKLERMFMGTDFLVTDLFDFWIDPQTTARGIKDAVEYGDCIESSVVKKTDLAQGEKNDIYTNLAKIENHYIGAKKTNQDEATKQRVKISGHITEDNPAANSKVKLERGNKSYEIKECFADFDLGSRGGGMQRVIITIGADQACIRLQKWQKDKPYLSSRYTPNGYNKEFYGTGIIENNLSNHYERNATRKQVVMARTMGLNMEMLSDQTGFQNKPDKLRTGPNKVHWVRNINGVKPFEKPIAAILNSALQHETNLKAESQMSMGNTPYVQGNDTSAINDTAAGIAQLTQAGNEKFSLPLQLDETGLLEPFVKRSLQNNISYRNEAFVIRLTDKTPVNVEPHQLSANFDVYSLGSNELQNKQIRQQGLEKFWALSMQAAQLEQMIYGAPLTKFFELKKELANNLGISNAENFIIDPATIAQGQQPQILTAEMEKILLRRMAEGVVPVMPIMIQPGEDYRNHYEDHLAFTTTEEFRTYPPQVQAIWYAHLAGYPKVLKTIDDKNKKVKANNAEVAVGA
jgi:hypothetical protein